MKRNWFIILVFGLFISCHPKEVALSGNTYAPRKTFSPKEQNILKAARQIIDRAYFGSFITIDAQGQPKVRLMEPFAPDPNFVIYLATNPKSRKVKEIEANSTASLHYVDKPRTGYVSLYGKIYVIKNDSIKKAHWKNGWERFYQNKGNAYTLLKFVPDYLEVISIRDHLNGDTKTWQPAKVILNANKKRLFKE